MGKQLKNILIIFCCILICFNLKMNVFASNYKISDFETYIINIDNINESFKESIIISETEIKNQNIRNFDVNSSGDIILCLCNNSINIYDNSIKFLYSIDFDINGTAIAFWYDEEPAVYLSKTDEIIQFDRNGIINAYKAKNTIENSSIYREIRGNKTIITDKFLYKLSHSSSFQKLLMTNPTKLSRINSDYEEIIYENSEATFNAFNKLILIIFFFLIFTSIIIIKIFYKTS